MPPGCLAYQQGSRWRQVLLALQVACQLLSIAYAECHVRLDIDSDVSTFTFTGNNQLIPGGGGTPLTGTISDTPGYTKGFSGALYAISTSLPSCPTTQADWLNALPGFTINSAVPYWYSPVELYPPVLPAETVGFPFQPQSVAMNITSTVQSVTGNAVVLSLTAAVLQGWLYSSSPVTGARYDSLVNLTSAAQLSGQLTYQETAPSKLLTLDVPSLAINFTTPPASLSVFGSAYTSISSIVITGRLLLKAELACTTSCGDKGRCVISNGSPTCQCECGWALDNTGACSVPKGSCSKFGSAASTSVATCNQTTSGPTTVTATQGSCPSGYGLNLEGSSCNQCVTGFSGPGCATCQSDSACQAAGGSSAYQCLHNATYLEKTTSKNYTCSISDPSVQSVLGDVVRFTCSTLPPSTASTAFGGVSLVGGGAGMVTATTTVVGTTPYCTMTFRMPTYASGSYTQCTGWGCSFAKDSTKASCSVVQCDCPTGCTTTTGSDLSSLFTGISGSIGIECAAPVVGSVEQACQLSMTGLPIAQMSISCNMSECYNPNGVANVAAGSEQAVKGQAVSDPIIAALPMFVLLGVAGLVLGATLSIALPYVSIPASQLAAGLPGTTTGPIAESNENSLAEAGSNDQHSYQDGKLANPEVALDVAPETYEKAAVINEQQPPFSSSSSSKDDASHGVDFKNMSNNLTFRFQDITVSSTTWSLLHKSSSSHILHGLSGSAAVGQVTGLLGPSGSGKSTLLNILSGQVQNGGSWAVSGTITLGDTLMTPSMLCHASAYVPQQGQLLRYLTVEETLRCSAALRLGRHTTPGEIQQRVEAVLTELNMARLRHSMIYKASTTLLSGGERQRLMIGMELVTKPLLLLLDEPTSGLDSYNAMQVLTTLQGVASAGRIVMTSLHQPSPVLFNMLHQAMLIAGGHMVFQGTPVDAQSAFAALGLPCPDNSFIAEHMLEVVGNPNTLPVLMEKITAPGYKELLLHQQHHDGPLKPSQDAAGLPVAEIKELPDMAPAPLLRVFGILGWRTLVDSYRNPLLTLLHIGFAIAIGLIVGFVYFRVGDDTAGAQNRVGSIFFVLNLFSFLGITALDVVQLERHVVEREMVRRYYSPWTYMALKVVMDSTLLRVLPGLLFSVLFYWIMGLRATAGAFLTFLCVFCTYNALVGSLTLLCGALCSTAGRAIIVLNLLLLNFVLFAGFLVNKSSITWVLRWICYVTPVRYAWEALVVNELQPMVLTLTAAGLPSVKVQGRLFLDLLGVDPDTLTNSIIVLDCMYVLVVVLALAGMALRIHLLRKGLA